MAIVKIVRGLVGSLITLIERPLVLETSTNLGLAAMVEYGLQLRDSLEESDIPTVIFGHTYKGLKKIMSCIGKWQCVSSVT